MPSANGVLTLPVNIRAELENRLVKSGYGSFEIHSEWLKSIGYRVSKSTIGRYALLNKSKLEEKTGTASMTDFEIATLKLQCLAICSNLDDEARFKKAFEFFEWATEANYKYATL